MKDCLAIITARGGSKRIPKKNIKPFLGVPIIKYSIDAALSSSCFDEVVVSTDDDEIAAIAKSFGASVPFMRSPDTSCDHSTTADVLLEVLREYGKLGKEFKHCCCIYPTAPFITGKKLRNAYNVLIASDVTSVVPVVRFGFPILRSFKMESNMIKMNWPEHINSRSQDLPPAFHDCGQFYFFKVEAFLQNPVLFSDKTFGLEMPEAEVQDIDTEQDWQYAEIKYKFQLENGRNN